MSSDEIDYVGQWFKVLRELHEPTNILFQIQTNDQTEVVRLLHENVDGYGALYSLAEKYNWTISPILDKNLPVKTRGITSLKYFWTCLLFLYWGRRRRKKLFSFDIRKNNTEEGLLTYKSFSEAETNLILEKAKLLNVSVNTLLFYKLNLALIKHFQIKSDASWWIPVNMRADLGLSLTNITGKKNYVSNFSIDIKLNTNITELQNQINASLKKQKHWGTWWWQNLGRYVSENLIKKIAESNLHSHYLGAFSNLGSWTCSDKNSNLMFGVPPLKSHPFGASAIFWNNRLNLGLRLYPGFPLAQNDFEKIMSSWADSTT